MGIQAVKLQFLGPVHFGAGRLSDSGHACDAATLFSALYIEAIHAGLQDGLMEAARYGDLTLSDMFPYIGETLYLPKPMLSSEALVGQDESRTQMSDSRLRKAHKKLAYVAAGRYGAYLSGSLDPVAELANFELGVSSLQAKVSLTDGGYEEPKPYFVGGWSFAPDAGLYFLVSGGYDLLPLLEQLSYAGLGGKRSAGYGRFEFSIENVDPKDLSMAGAVRTYGSVLLSTAIPRPEELTDELLTGARYRIVRKGGFVQSQSHAATPQKKRDLYLFAAGSVFQNTFEGDVFDVNATSGAHSVYRYARAMWMEV